MIRAKRFPSGARLNRRPDGEINPWSLGLVISLLLWALIWYAAYVVTQ